MNKKLYVGNLAYAITSEQLGELFAKHGRVARANVITYHDTGRSKGFGFVEMDTEEEAKNAIAALNGVEHEGRPLTVDARRGPEGRAEGAGDRGQDRLGGGRFGRGGRG
jgi:RNA recognition motif-containing protein